MVDPSWSILEYSASPRSHHGTATSVPQEHNICNALNCLLQHIHVSPKLLHMFPLNCFPDQSNGKKD